MSLSVHRYMVDYYRTIMSEFLAAFTTLIPHQITSIKVSIVHGKVVARHGDNVRVTTVSESVRILHEFLQLDTSRLPHFTGSTENHEKLLAELANSLLHYEGLVNGTQLDTHIKSLRQSNNIHQDEIVIVLLSTNPEHQGQ